MVNPVPDNHQPDAARRCKWLSNAVALVLGSTLILYLLVPDASTVPAPRETPDKTLPPDSSVLAGSQEDSATDFDTSLDVLVALKEAGIGDGVIPVSPFREKLSGGGEGPEMVVIPAGRFRMGCLSKDDSCNSDEKPIHEVRISQAFALSVHEVTFEDYDRFTYPNKVYDEGWGRGNRPVINVRLDDIKKYVAWLSSQTGSEYRLPSEAEWEYAARAGSTTKYSWGDEIGTNRANCVGCGSQWDGKQTAPVGSFAPNGFGLYDMHGNVWEWVEDCWNNSYAGASSDGVPWLQGDCAMRVLRGGAWCYIPRNLRAAYRYEFTNVFRNFAVGFRVTRKLDGQFQGRTLPQGAATE